MPILCQLNKKSEIFKAVRLKEDALSAWEGGEECAEIYPSNFDVSYMDQKLNLTIEF